MGLGAHVCSQWLRSHVPSGTGEGHGRWTREIREGLFLGNCFNSRPCCCLSVGMVPGAKAIPVATIHGTHPLARYCPATWGHAVHPAPFTKALRGIGRAGDRLKSSLCEGGVDSQLPASLPWEGLGREGRRQF